MKIIKVLLEAPESNIVGVEIDGKECIVCLDNTTGEVLKTWDIPIKETEDYLKHGISL